MKQIGIGRCCMEQELELEDVVWNRNWNWKMLYGTGIGIGRCCMEQELELEDVVWNRNWNWKMLYGTGIGIELQVASSEFCVVPVV